MKTILVPTDFSKLSEHALEFAIRIAKPLEASIDLLHLEAVPLGDTSLNLAGGHGGAHLSKDTLFNAQLFRANKQKLVDLADRYDSREVPVRYRQLGGGFLEGIKHFLQEEKIDLIVLGTTGEQSVQEFFSGNHTEQLIEHVNVPVLSVQDQQFHPIEDIVLGLDLEEEKYTQGAFSKVKMICDALGSTLHIIDVTRTKEDEQVMQKLHKIAKIAGLSNFMVDVIDEKDPEKALLEYAEGTDAGLVIILSEAKGGLHRFFQHSFAARATKDSSIPVLTINKSMI